MNKEIMGKIESHEISYDDLPLNVTFKIRLKIKNIDNNRDISIIDQDFMYMTIYPLECTESICKEDKCDHNIYKTEYFREQLHKIIKKELKIDEE